MTDILNALSDPKTLISALSLVVAFWSAYSSKTSKDLAKTSADSAKASAEASKLTARISQFDVLAPHFENIHHFIRALMGEENISVPKIDSIRQSIRSLSAAFLDDKKFSEILELLLTVIDNPAFKNEMHKYLAGGTRININNFCPSHLSQLLPVFLQKKTDYLQIT